MSPLEREKEREREGINLRAAERRWQHTVIAVAVYPFKCRRSRAGHREFELYLGNNGLSMMMNK